MYPHSDQLINCLTSTLLVVAHPDDEVLGCGGTALQRAMAGVRVQACILSGPASARRHRPETGELRRHMDEASKCLGMPPPIVGDFDNLSLNTVPHRELTAFIESAIEATGATTIFTHHPADLNDDHLHVSRACQAAARLSHRKDGVPPLCGLHYMEVLSSTDWAFPSGMEAFAPNCYMPLDPEAIERKIEALKVYEGVTRPFPHSRSPEAIRALAALRGAQANVMAAEAFQTAFCRMSIPGTLG